jgi:hypothetical protein
MRLTCSIHLSVFQPPSLFFSLCVRLFTLFVYVLRLPLYISAFPCLCNPLCVFSPFFVSALCLSYLSINLSFSVFDLFILQYEHVPLSLSPFFSSSLLNFSFSVSLTMFVFLITLSIHLSVCQSPLQSTLFV